MPETLHGYGSEEDGFLAIALDCCPFGFATFDAAGALTYANASYYSLLQLPREAAALGMSIKDIISYMITRGDYMGDADTPEHLLTEQVNLALSGTKHQFHRTRQNGARLSIDGHPLPDGGFLRTYFDVTAASEQVWQLKARARLLHRRLSAIDPSITPLDEPS